MNQRKRRRWFLRYVRTRSIHSIKLFKRYVCSYWYKTTSDNPPEWKQDSFIRLGFWLLIPRKKIVIPGELRAGQIQTWLDDLAVKERADAAEESEFWSRTE
jgi:hypothetical protein